MSAFARVHKKICPNGYFYLQNFLRRCIIEKKMTGENAMIKTIAKPQAKKVTGCGECRSTCQSACKTSCTVGNQSCERVTREEKIERR